MCRPRSAAGSIPALLTEKTSFLKALGDIAHQVEHLVCNQKVWGSSPHVSTWLAEASHRFGLPPAAQMWDERWRPSSFLPVTIAASYAGPVVARQGGFARPLNRNVAQ